MWSFDLHIDVWYRKALGCEPGPDGKEFIESLTTSRNLDLQGRDQIFREWAPRPTGLSLSKRLSSRLQDVLLQHDRKFEINQATNIELIDKTNGKADSNRASKDLPAGACDHFAVIETNHSEVATNTTNLTGDVVRDPSAGRITPRGRVMRDIKNGIPSTKTLKNSRSDRKTRERERAWSTYRVRSRNCKKHRADTGSQDLFTEQRATACGRGFIHEIARSPEISTRSHPFAEIRPIQTLRASTYLKEASAPCNRS